MKINKLYKLGQFVDIIKLNGIGLESESLDNIIDYNEILNQPLTIEMVFNSIIHPNEDMRERSSEKYNTAWSKWQEAEKKFILTGWKRRIFFKSDVLCFMLNDLVLIFNKGKVHFENIKSDNNGFEIVTLEDLAYHTNGELVAKNLEI